MVWTARPVSSLGEFGGRHELRSHDRPQPVFRDGGIGANLGIPLSPGAQMTRAGLRVGKWVRSIGYGDHRPRLQAVDEATGIPHCFWQRRGGGGGGGHGEVWGFVYHIERPIRWILLLLKRASESSLLSDSFFVCDQACDQLPPVQIEQSMECSLTSYLVGTFRASYCIVQFSMLCQRIGSSRVKAHVDLGSCNLIVSLEALASRS